MNIIVVDVSTSVQNAIESSLKYLKSLQKKYDCRYILVLNKCDLVDSEYDTRQEYWQAEVSEILDLDKIILVSAQTGYNLIELREYLYTHAIDCEWTYPSGCDAGVYDSRTRREIVYDTIQTVLFR